MARLPIDQARPGRPEIWAALRALRLARLESLEAASRAHPKTLADYLEALAAAGIVAIARTGRRRDWTIRLCRDTGAEAPRVRRDGRILPPPKTEAIWRAMKMLRHFTIEELVIAAEAHPLQTKDYVLTLAKAGYLAVAERTHPKPARYRFVPAKNSGPLPPQLQRVGSVYDPNLRQVVWADVDAAARRFDGGARPGGSGPGGSGS